MSAQSLAHVALDGTARQMRYEQKTGQRVQDQERGQRGEQTPMPAHPRRARCNH